MCALSSLAGGSQRDYADHADFDTATLTVAAWVNTTTTTRNLAFANRGDLTVNGDWYLGIGGTAQRWGFRVRIGGVTYVVQTGANFTTGVWQHVAGVYNKVNALVYQDGSLTTGDAATADLPAEAGLVRLWNQLACSLAEFGVWAGALSADDIGMLADGFCPELVRPDILVLHDHLIRAGGPYDTILGLGSDAGTITVEAHPRIYFRPTMQMNVWPRAVTIFIPVIRRRRR